VVLLTGFVLIVVGIVCLYLSDNVASAGSWRQATLDAFGVGFIVGGLVDVLAISLLNQIITGEQRRRENNAAAEVVLNTRLDDGEKPFEAKELLNRAGRQIDPRLRKDLEEYINRASG
jgi:hypothetical protein